MNHNMEYATFAGGCFWCLQGPFDHQTGVISTEVGYTGGTVINPDYDEVSTGKTGHREAIRITFDPSIVSYDELLEIFWRNIDPTDPQGQFSDRGTQYQTAIFYNSEQQKKRAELSIQNLIRSGLFSKPIVTEILPAVAFYPAEDYHQAYYKKNPFRYELYRHGSGRDSYIHHKWDKQA